VTSDSRTRSTHRQRLAALVALAILAGCATQPGHEELRARHAALDLAAYQARAPQSAPSVTLRSALECALNHNIEVWLAEHERQFQHELSTQSLLKLLPSLLAGAESSWRSELDAASSESLRRHKQSLEPSYSSEQTSRTWDISTTWSLLDFGISYFRAQQQADRAWIAVQRVRRVKQDLALQVTRAYWQVRDRPRVGARGRTHRRRSRDSHRAEQRRDCGAGHLANRRFAERDQAPGAAGGAAPLPACLPGGAY
jgi:hypothetical protein